MFFATVAFLCLLDELMSRFLPCRVRLPGPEDYESYYYAPVAAGIKILRRVRCGEGNDRAVWWNKRWACRSGRVAIRFLVDMNAEPSDGVIFNESKTKSGTDMITCGGALESLLPLMTQIVWLRRNRWNNRLLEAIDSAAGEGKYPDFTRDLAKLAEGSDTRANSDDANGKNPDQTDYPDFTVLAEREEDSVPGTTPTSPCDDEEGKARTQTDHGGWVAARLVGL
jgi:hypothetical protein